MANAYASSKRLPPSLRVCFMLSIPTYTLYAFEWREGEEQSDKVIELTREQNEREREREIEGGREGGRSKYEVNNIYLPFFLPNR